MFININKKGKFIMDLFNGKYFKKNNTKILNEENLYKTKQDSKYSIAIDFSLGYTLALLIRPYFKVYNTNNYNAENCKSVRIYFNTGELDYNHKDGKGKFILSNKNKLDIIDRLKRRNTYYKDLNINVYDAMWKFLKDKAEMDKLPIADYIPIQIFERNFLNE